MARTPVVAIVGRTNVGKSSLFNCLLKKRLAVVDDQPGVTRDRVYARVQFDGKPALLVDTGGLAGPEEDELFTRVRDQALAALEEADLIIFVVDAREGLVSLDWEVAETIRRAGKPTILVANKAEVRGADVHQFAELGFGEPLAVSAAHRMGINELIDRIVELLPEAPEEPSEEEAVPALAIIGRPNAGKSSLVNALAGEERVIVSETPGTTTDAVDTRIEFDGQPLLLVDTAGLRRKFKRAAGVEYYAAVRALRAIERADVAALLIDATEGPTFQDARLAGMVEEMGRGIVLCLHKWDLVVQEALKYREDEEIPPSKLRRQLKLLQDDYKRVVQARLSFVSYAPIICTSAVTGEGLQELLSTALDVARRVNMRVETGSLNRIVRDIMAAHPPPVRKGKPLKVYYATQVEVKPPTIVMFCNDPDRLDASYERYLINSLREKIYGEGVPIRLIFRPRRREQKR